MLWLKGWIETRWRLVFVLFMGAIMVGFPLEKLGSVPVAVQARLISILWGNMSVLLAFIAAITMAGSGIQTTLTRPGRSEKSGEESTVFTLSLPVTRTRLFVVRTIIGVLETVALLALFVVVVGLLAPPLMVNVHGALGFFAAIIACSLAAYAISACLSTFCDEGWRFRLSVIVVAVFFLLTANLQRPDVARSATLPQSIDIFGLVAAPLSTHQIPWVMIIAACVVASLFFAAALTIIHRRDY